jgi:hypothetical protein
MYILLSLERTCSSGLQLRTPRFFPNSINFYIHLLCHGMLTCDSQLTWMHFTQIPRQTSYVRKPATCFLFEINLKLKGDFFSFSPSPICVHTWTQFIHASMCVLHYQVGNICMLVRFDREMKKLKNILSQFLNLLDIICVNI